MTGPGLDAGAGPVGTALDAFRAALVTFARETAVEDAAIASAAFERARLAVEAALGEPSHTEIRGAESSYDMVIRNAMHFRLRTILDEAQAAIAEQRGMTSG